MALLDLQSFIVERLSVVDPNEDLTPGSPVDVQVIQPILRRIGSDPFTVDLGTFLQDRLNQAFPALATKEGDAVTDLLIKTAMVLWDPIVRENQRIRKSLSFRDPTTLTTDEAEALGANLFATRNTGDFARGRGRVYFAQPQNITVTPANYITSKSNLAFYPTEIQSISTEEMLFNKESDLYYFDVSLIAAKAGDEYNLDIDQLVTIANLSSAVRLTNKARFRTGAPEESAVQFVDRIEQELSERSLVTLRGIVAKLNKAFPELTRLGVVGAGDPQMNRDLVTGGGLGALLAGGLSATALPDGENKLTTRRVQVSDADFTSLIGPVGPVSGYTVTLHAAFPAGSLPLVRDLVVKAVVGVDTLDLNDQVLDYAATGKAWALRKHELTLSNIPGGLLFPSNSQGTVSIPNNQIHVGGATDIYVRGTDFDTSSVVFADLVDDSPVLSGRLLDVPSTTTSVTLVDLVLGSNYALGDGTHQALEDAATKGYSLQILDPPNAGSYRVLRADQSGVNPVLTIRPSLMLLPGSAARWRLLDTLDIDLIEPKETKVSGNDMFSIQGVDAFDTASGIDFSAYGVGAGDVVRVATGSVAGDYTVVQVLTPLFRRVQVDRPLAASVGSLKFSIFRENAEGGVKLPLVRIDSIDLLDTSAQPVGSKVPYARPIDIQTRAFANVSHGIKADITDGLLGIISQDLGSPAGAAVDGLTLLVGWSQSPPFTVTFAGTDPIPLADLVDQINVECAGISGIPRIAVLVGNRIGILPVAPGVQVTGGTARTALFGADLTYSASDVRSQSTLTDWTTLSPPLDGTFDVVQLLDGLQIGFYGGLSPEAGQLHTGHDFFPEFGRHLQVGSRSIGSVRTYFLEPTTVEFGKGAVFSLTGPNGSVLRYFADPTVNYQRIPALPSGTKPKDGVVTVASPILTSSSVDFIAKGIQPEDIVVVDYEPITGALALGDPVTGLSTLTLVLSINGGLDKTVTFITDDPTIPRADVTRQGVADQVNRTVGQIICKITTTGHLEFEADASIILRHAGTANTLLGFSVTIDQSNDAKGKGHYIVRFADVGQLTMTRNFGAAAARQQFKVFRAGLQRIGSTDMSKRVGTAGLYYFDVELISEGTGDAYNIDAGLQMSAAGYASDGYWLTTDDPNLSFSELERARLHLSRSILEVGVSDDPDNATQLSGQNIQVNYDRSSLTQNVQSFVSAETERVVNESILCRHLIPYFVRFDLIYMGGSKENEVTADVESYITGIDPDDTLEVGALEKILSNRGATSITNPVDLVAVIHNTDRTVSVERSQDRLGTGALAAFIPDALNITRKLS